MIHHSEDIVREELWKERSKILVQRIQEFQGTLNDLPSGRFLEKLGLSDDRFDHGLPVSASAGAGRTSGMSRYVP